MFRGRSAWFSESVSPGPRERWAAGGGECARWQDAEYLFSSDAAHPDTRRPPDQGEPVDEALYRQIGTASHSQALVLMGDFNHPDICWSDRTAQHKQSRRFLDCVEDNFLLQAAEEPTRREYMRASITWRTEPRSSTLLTSLHGPTPVWERRRRWLWATLSCHPLAYKKRSEGRSVVSFGSRRAIHWQDRVT
ncbi:telomere repeats-binding bouquet formation protein 2 isoform X2 [Lathamus discolor]|uniref:telomere repeats-binding bouquet formation protein 2 isoform X2 n=1 Tax=Lathamus discolor TaxID=678569 RepID=UPI0032B7CAB4